MSKTHCRFCKLNFKGIYVNCPKCGKFLPPFKGEDIAPDEEYEVVE